jgi:hypothetical protein
LITESKDFGTSFSISEKTINKLLKSEVITSVLDWVEAKAAAAERAKERELNKDLDKKNLRKITKFTDASDKIHRDQTMLFICEGDSASNAILSARTPLIGCYPLKGKPINAMGTDVKHMMENKEFVDLLAVTGLKIGKKVDDISQLHFGKIVSCTDADCVEENTTIVSDKGLKQIKDVKPGDKVLTHTGDYETVVAMSESIKTAEIVINGIHFSENHKIPVLSNGEIVIKLAKDVETTDKLLIKK